MKHRSKSEDHKQDSASPLAAVLIVLGLLSCCLMPLALGALSFVGAWLSNLPALQAYRPWLLATAVVAMFFAWRSIYRPTMACQPGEACAAPQPRLAHKIVFWIVAVALFNVLGYPYVAKYFY